MRGTTSPTQRNNQPTMKLNLTLITTMFAINILGQSIQSPIAISYMAAHGEPPVYIGNKVCTNGTVFLGVLEPDPSKFVELSRTDIRSIFGQEGRFAKSVSLDSCYAGKKLCIWVLDENDDGSRTFQELYEVSAYGGCFTSKKWIVPSVNEPAPYRYLLITSEDAEAVGIGEHSENALVLHNFIKATAMAKPASVGKQFKVTMIRADGVGIGAMKEELSSFVINAPDSMSNAFFSLKIEEIK